MFSEVAIIGLGLIGGSLAKDLKKAGIKVTGTSRNKETVNYAIKHGIIESDDISNADLIVIATPLDCYDSVFLEIKDKIKQNAIITDVGSVKGCTINSAKKILSENQFKNFVPGHPIAGKEISGIKAASNDLFKNKKTILTPTKETSDEAIKKLRDMWQLIGAEVEIKDPDEHDRIYAFISHMVQKLAFGIKKEDEKEFSENFLRLKNSNREMWDAIFEANKKNLQETQKLFEDNFEKQGNLQQQYARTLLKITPPEYIKYAGSAWKDLQKQK